MTPQTRIEITPLKCIISQIKKASSPKIKIMQLSTAGLWVIYLAFFMNTVHNPEESVKKLNVVDAVIKS